MRRCIPVIVLLLVGCGQSTDDYFDKLAGNHSERVPLTTSPVVLSSEPMPFPMDRPLTMLGKTNAVCFALRSDVALRSQHEMEQLLADGLQGAEIHVVVTTDDGKSLDLPAENQGWRKYGVITGSGELSACASVALGHAQPGKKHVTSISASSSDTLRVLGVYWTSTDDFDPPRR